MIKQGDAFRFDSLQDLAAWLEKTPRFKRAGDTSTEGDSTDSWDLGLGFAGTLKIAAGGGFWPQGAAMVRKGVAVAADLAKQSLAPVIEYGVVGFAPDVPAYLAGVPDNMMMMGGTGISAVSPIVSIGVPNASGSVTASSIMNRGIAIVTLVDALESQGYRVEVSTALGCTNGQSGKTLCDATVVIKQAHEPWNPNSMAFGMGHPALIRRLGFAVRERCKGSVLCTRQGYGTGALVDPERYTVALPWLTKEMTLEQALQYVQDIANAGELDVSLLDKG